MSLSEEDIKSMTIKWENQRKQILEQYNSLLSEKDVDISPQVKLQFDLLFKIMELNTMMYISNLALLHNIAFLSSRISDLGLGFGAPPPTDNWANMNILSLEHKVDQIIRLLGSTPYTRDL